jgi:DNA primase
VNKNANLDIIRERLNVLDVVSTYIKVDKAGSQFRARCPFHNEKTPSFYVSPSRGTYHCFGCGEHGDIFGFVMKIEGINFKDALKMLADKAGVVLSNIKKEEESNLVDILEQATIFFEKNLSQNEEAKKYLAKRGVSLETIQKFRIGFAPNDWRQLYSKLHTAKYSDEEIVSSGLCIKHEKGLYDRFRSRIVFPIFNASGKVVAFSGRIIGPDEGKEGIAKYVNSPETPMYHKSSILYGYNFARHDIARSKKVLVVEGQMDVVMCHQAGNTNTVAISGTAFTPEHISILKRFAEKVVLALDTDKAGYTAMLKSAALALENDLEVDGIKLTEKDPADMIKTDMENWKKISEDERPILTLITEIIMEKEKVKPRQVQMLRRDLFPLLRVVKSPLLKESYTKEVSLLLGIDESIIRQETENVKSEIELQVKKEKKKVPQIETLTMLAQVLAGLNAIKNPEMRNRLRFILDDYLKMQDKLNIEAIPEDILNKEEMLLEKRINEIANYDTVKNSAENVLVFVRKLSDEIIQSKKELIKNGEEVEKNLKEIQELTRKINGLTKELGYN